MTTNRAAEIRSRPEARELFAGLARAEPEELLGRWDGRMLGGPALVAVGKAMALLTPFRGWCGKEFGPGRVANLAKRHGVVTRVQDGITSAGTSMLDRLPALIVEYRQTAVWPTRRMRAEVRWLEPGKAALGMLFMPIRSHIALGPFPYLLTRASESSGSSGATA